MRTAAGVIQFTVIFISASSFPSDFVRPMTPAFAALYGAALGLPSFPAIEAILTIRPYLFSLINGTRALQQRKVPFRSMSTTFIHSSIGNSQVLKFGPAIPALFTRISAPPIFLKLFSAAALTEPHFVTSTT